MDPDQLELQRTQWRLKKKNQRKQKKCTKTPKAKKKSDVVDDDEPSEYEKIRESNIAQLKEVAKSIFNSK